MSLLQARHIQNFSEASQLEPHWGYADRVVPCVVDAGSCSYLDLIYGSHDRSMFYVGILWSVILGILLLWSFIRLCVRSAGAVTPRSYVQLCKAEEAGKGKSSVKRLYASLASVSRRYLLPDACRAIFGRISRLQVLTLAILTGYLIIFTFAGLTYEKWITPVKNYPGLYNTRSTLGPWSNRVGVLAYGLTPLSIMLASRESILSLATGIPGHHFNFLHRWLGYIILIQGLTHTVGWTIIEVKLYQPQPQVASAWIKETYMIWGCVAILLLLLLWVLSLSAVIKRTGYEFFRKVHYLLAMLFIGACWGHWAQLKCFLLPSLLIWFVDRGLRLLRSFLLHYGFLSNGSLGFRPAEANVTVFPDPTNGTVVRLDFDHQMHQPWQIGQHFYLCFPQSSIWQSHPFTPLSLPQTDSVGKVRHSYIFRAKSGETAKVARMVMEEEAKATTSTTSIIMAGPYGQSIYDPREEMSNILCVAGGTGITYVLPVLLDLVRNGGIAPGRQVSLVWAVRLLSDADWIKDELHELKRCGQISVTLFCTRDATAAAQCMTLAGAPTLDDIKTESEGEESKSMEQTCACCSSSTNAPGICTCDAYQTCYLRPNLDVTVQDFVKNTSSGATTVYASGPGSMLSNLRRVVAQCNNSKLSKYEECKDVKLIHDERLEW